MPTVAQSLIFCLPLWNSPSGFCFLLPQSEFSIGLISPSSLSGPAGNQFLRKSLGCRGAGTALLPFAEITPRLQTSAPGIN